MALDQVVKAALQCLGVQMAAQAQGRRDVIRGALRVQLPEEPLAFLGVRQAQRLVACDPDQGRLVADRFLRQGGDERLQGAAFEQAAQGHIGVQGMTHTGDDLGSQQ